MYNMKWHCKLEKKLLSPFTPPWLYPQAPWWVTVLPNLCRQNLRLSPRGGSGLLLWFSLLFFILLCIWSFFLQLYPETQTQYFDTTVHKSFERHFSMPIRNRLDVSHLWRTSQNHVFHFNSCHKTRRGYISQMW